MLIHTVSLTDESAGTSRKLCTHRMEHLYFDALDIAEDERLIPAV